MMVALPCDYNQRRQNFILNFAAGGRSISLYLLMKNAAGIHQIFKPESQEVGITVNAQSFLLILKPVTYRQFPKYSDTQNICCNHSKI